MDFDDLSVHLLLNSTGDLTLTNSLVFILMNAAAKTISLPTPSGTVNDISPPVFTGGNATPVNAGVTFLEL
jgi:hypothetical protein